MKIVLMAIGSRGDAAPMASLARELVHRGVPTTVVVLRELSTWVAGQRRHPD